MFDMILKIGSTFPKKKAKPGKHLPVQSQQQKHQKRCEVCSKSKMKTPERQH